MFQLPVKDGGPRTGTDADIGTRIGTAGIPMFVHTPGKELRILGAEDRPTLEAGRELIGLTEPRRRLVGR